MVLFGGLRGRYGINQADAAALAAMVSSLSVEMLEHHATRGRTCMVRWGGSCLPRLYRRADLDRHRASTKTPEPIRELLEKCEVIDLLPLLGGFLIELRSLTANPAPAHTTQEAAADVTE